MIPGANRLGNPWGFCGIQWPQVAHDDPVASPQCLQQLEWLSLQPRMNLVSSLNELLF